MSVIKGIRISFNPKTELMRRKSFYYADGVCIEIGDTVYFNNKRDAGKFKVCAINPYSMLVLIGKLNVIHIAEPHELEFIHRK